MEKIKRNNLILSIISIAVFLVIWYLCTAILELVPSKTLPDPIKIYHTFIDKFTNPNPDGGTLIEHTLASLRTALTGYFVALIIGIPLGILMAWYKYIDRFVRPVFDLIKPIPGIAWIPLMIVVFGIGIKSKAAVVFFSAVVPCILNSYTGIKQTRDVHLWVARTFGATNFQMLQKIAIPTALPYIMTGVRVALGSAWIAIVAAELLGSTKGLGFMIQQSRGIFRTDIIIVGMIAIGICGAALTQILTIVEKKVVKGRIDNE
ncbi:ABC transporter permease [Clostridium sediminicola]|uniref:ABC transporter permease n=1 Tax=Clostridium sediminicola TaxID=3114879 RepID=UPI0031F1C765